MAETNLQQETGGRFASPAHGTGHPVHRAEPPNIALVPDAADGPAASTAGTALTLVLPPGNAPVPAQAFAAFIAQALPGARLDVRSGPDWADMPAGPVVVLTADPVRTLAWRIQQGMAPDRALAEWTEAAEALLGLHRRDRRRVIPVDPAILDPDMAAARDLLTARLLKLPAAPALAVPSGTGLPGTDEMPDTAALDPEAATLALVMLDDPAVAELAEELRAVTLGLGTGCDRQGLALAAWKRATATRTRASLLGDQLRLQIERDEGESLRLQQEARLLSDNLALQGSLRKDLSDRNAALEKRVKELEDALAAEQARGRREREQLTAQKAALELRRAHAQRRVEAVLASRSWRLTKPVRAIARLVPGRG